VKGGRGITSTSSWRQRFCEKERKERMALMSDEDFEGDFLEVQENSPGIANAASAVLY
jgi:hypothetical protein